MVQKKMPIETLAAMINEGFKATVTQEDIKQVNTWLEGMDERLGRIENLLLAEQKREIEDLKKRMKRLEAPSLSKRRHT
jgi:hypothetical protein